MAETVAIDRPPVAEPATVSASVLALHLDCSRTYIGKLEAEGVIQRQGDGFPLDQSRVAYLRYLRRERRQSPRSEADADFQRAKSELIRLRVAEKKRDLIPLDEAISHMDEVVGLFLTHLSGFAARCGGRDLAVRRAIDQAVYELRRECRSRHLLLAPATLQARAGHGRLEQGVRLLRQASGEVGGPDMCTSIIEIARAEGMAKRGDEWFPLSQAVVAYDHARHAPLGDVITLDFINLALEPGARAGIELTLETAKELRAALDRAIAAAEFEEAEVRGKGAVRGLVRAA
jgi:hypothetical protein